MQTFKPTSRGVVVDTSRSPYCQLRPVPVGAVRLSDPFWMPRLRINREETLPAQYHQCEETGRIDNFRRASGKKQIEFQGIYFNDSDVYKWMEAVAFALAESPDPELKAMLDGVIAEVAAAEDSDGYLNTYFTFERKPERFTNLRDMHEMYCAGHLLQAAVAHHRATGDRALLEVAIRLADHLCETFGAGKRPGTDGHEEIELAMVELYRETGDDRYLRQADFFIGQRGRKPSVLGGSPYHQDHLPYREQRENTGHAVRMLYLNSGAADVFAETGDAGLGETLERLWRNFHERRQYVTGGAGARYEGEAFGGDYELPNDRAYTETCAAIASVMWNWRMLALSGEARFADDLEIALYNGVLAGLSLSGTDYFYQNPLADRGKHRRQPWFGCACCPPNIARMLASLPGYVYSVSEPGTWIHLYAEGSAEIALLSGSIVSLSQETRYPWDGEVEITVKTESSEPFSLFLRIPSWCRGATIAVNDGPAESASSGSYHELRRRWRSGDVVRLSLPMTARLLESHLHVASNHGQAAVQRGPLVYCLEGVDHPGVDVRDIAIPADARWEAEFRPDLLSGIAVLKTEGFIADRSEWDGVLYCEFRNKSAVGKSVPVVAVPYYAWANRDPGPMRVWIPVLAGSGSPK